MKNRTMFTLGLSAFALTAGALSAGAPGMTASAASAENPKRAAGEAKAAQKAIAKRQGDLAVQHAEAAVAYASHNAEYRAVLGQAYMMAGRFTSARQAFTDSLSLDPQNGRVALNLALTQIAGGDWAGARSTLEANSATIAPSDRGLAMALAGDPVGAVTLLSDAAHAGDASPKTRQNLALSLALAGRWQEARAVAAVDVSPDQLDARMMEWASFARPKNAYDQVASLLGVRPVEDGGQPAQLALNQAPNVAVAAAAPAADPVDAAMPGAPAAADQVAADAAVPTVDPQPELTSAAVAAQQVVFAPRQEVVQALPADYGAQPSAVPSRAAPREVTATRRVAAASTAAPAKGKYFVQLGAYASPAVARDAWKRTAAKVPEVGRHTPQGARVSTRAGNFYRLSVGGFARADADSLCRTVKSSGGICFVRVAAGDQVASWVRNSNTEVASR